MIKVFNLFRYEVAILVPVLALLKYDAVIGVICSVVVLYLNNVFDDIVFYYGSAFVDYSWYKGGIPSPVNGVVTKIEYGVPMYHHISKADMLTKDKILDAFKDEDSDELYNHVTIFLNKLNKHIVANIGNLISMKTYDRVDKDDSMVESGELIAKNCGGYLNNTFVELRYGNGVRVVVTMDKYISKAILSKHEDIEMLICRGSQCDLYLPESYPISVDIDQKIEIYQTISQCAGWCKKNNLYDIFKAVVDCVKESGFNIYKAMLENLHKTLCTTTYNSFYLWAILVALLVDYRASLVFLFWYMYLFLFDRSVKNLMYSIMNIIGYKPIMTTLYKSINKILVYGK